MRVCVPIPTRERGTLEMAGTGWVQLLTAALGGGFTVKALDIIYQEFRHWFERSRSAERFVDEHLDPLLKSADELVGKLRALAERDFRGLGNTKADTERLQSPEFSSVLFLFARFWARIEIVRHQGSVAITQTKRGKQLQDFLDCLESRRMRMVDRITQRAAGEVMIRWQNGHPDTVTFVEFVKTFESDAEIRRWISPLALVISRVGHTYERQRILQYGTVVHALIDTLDPKHQVTRTRPSYPNKLTRRSWRDLKYRVFRRYLPFVSGTEKYVGTSKK
jgi:hypothetical protein